MTARSYHSSVQRVLLTVLALNLIIAIAKLMVGLWTSSISVIASAFDSFVDSASDVIALISLGVAGRPPDANHPYGHRKYETIATLAIGALLLIGGWEILTEAVHRLQGGAPPQVTLVSILILLATLPANWFLSAYEARRGRELRSDLLRADSTHIRTDIAVTLSVVAGLIGVQLGLRWLDAALGLVVVGIIVWVAFGIFRQTSYVLTDTAVVDPDRVADVARSVHGVWFSSRIRSRGQPNAFYVDLHIKVDPAMSTEQAHAIASEVERRLKAQLPGLVDAVVHVEPGQQAPPDPYEALLVRVRQIADGVGVSIHEVHFNQTPQGTEAQMHVEVPGELSLEAAHALVSDLEDRVRAEIPDIAHVETHIEPLPQVAPLSPDGVDLAELQRRVREVASQVWGIGGCHQVSIHRADGQVEAVLHCSMPGDVPLVQAHELSERVERRLLDDIPALSRVTVHVEPIGEEGPSDEA